MLTKLLSKIISLIIGAIVIIDNIDLSAENVLPVVAPPCGFYSLTTNNFAGAAINATNTGKNGLCLLCSVTNTANVVDVNLTNFATLNLASVGGTAYISVKSSTIQPIGVTTGYVLNGGLLSLTTLGGVVIKTYKAGVFQEASTAGTLLNLGFNGGSQSTVGFETTKTFDEVQLVIGGLASVASFDVLYPYIQYTDLNITSTVVNPTTSVSTDGSINTIVTGGKAPYSYSWDTGGSTSGLSNKAADIYTLTVTDANGCTALKRIGLLDPNCSFKSFTTNNYPVKINSTNTGTGGICIGCSVSNTANLIDANISNTSTITLVAGVGGYGTLSVEDTVFTYPAGYKVGYIVTDGGVFGASLLGNTIVSTYLEGVLQESGTASGLLDLPLFVGFRTIAFSTTKQFDQIQIRINALASILTNTQVYHAFVDCPNSFTLNCGTPSVSGTFSANGTGGQTGTLNVPITSATASIVTFNLSGASGFSPATYTATLTNGQTSVAIPITFDGSGLFGTRTLDIVSSQGFGTCSANLTINAPCLIPSVGGVTALTTGVLPLCTSANSGTITLTAHVGSVVKWQTSTDGGTAWTDITNTLNSYDFANALDNQQFRAVVNNGGTCLDAYSLSLPVTVSPLACPCLTPSVGGVVGLTSGSLPLCSTNNLGTLGLTGQIGNIVKWQTSTDGGTAWTDITNTLNSYDFANALDNQQFRAVVNNGGTCLDAYSLSLPVTVSPLACPCLTPSVGGVVGLTSGSLPLCSTNNLGTLGLTGQIGNIVKWQTSTNGGTAWTDITNTLNSYDFANALDNQHFRAVVNNGGTCLDAYSLSSPVTVSPLACPCLTPSVGGVVGLTSGVLPLASPLNTGTLGVLGQVGNILKWQTSTDGGTTWIDIANTTANYNFSDVAHNQLFRTVVNSGGSCKDTYSSSVTLTTLGVNCSCLVPSVGGSVALTTGTLPLCSTSNSGTLGLVGNIGSILKWQTSTNSGSSWTDISNTSNSLDFTNALNNQQYRAVVNNGAACGDVNSLPFVIVLSPLGCPCLTPSFGGVVALTSGVLPLCAPLNMAEISLTGQVGNIANWQTSTDGGTTWTEVSNTSANYNITNAANNQQFRAVVNAGGSCKDAYSASVALSVSPIACPCLIPSVGGTVALTVGILPFPTPLNTGVLSLIGQIGNIVKWQTSTDSGTTWTDIANTTASYSFANASNNQKYRAVVNNGGACGDVFSSSTSITVTGSAFPCLVPSIGGIVALTSGILPLCSSSNSGTVSLVGHIGNIVKWQTSTNSGSSWTDISNTTASYNFTNAVNNQLYRAVVNNGGVCGDAYSLSATILVSSLACPCLVPSVGGVVALTSGVLPLCVPLNIGTISLSGQIGNIAKWQSSTDDGATWTNIANTTASYDFSNAADNQQYRVVVNNGGSCVDAYSLSIALPVSPLSCPCLTPSVGGIVNLASGLLLPLSSPLNGGNLNLIGQVGTVSKWQTSTDGGSTWLDIVNTLPSYNFTNALNNQQYRAVINNGGACADAYSASIPITITQPTCPCLTPSVGGVTILTDGVLPLCSTTNSGTVGLTGQVGNTVKWQISLDVGLTWTDVAANTVSFTFANALNGQFIRSIVNNGAGCLDAPSLPLILQAIISACIEIVNGIDDDGNGLTDCADPNCITKAVAPALIKRKN